jgi:hypothetical protein
MRRFTSALVVFATLAPSSVGFAKRAPEFFLAGPTPAQAPLPADRVAVKQLLEARREANLALFHAYAQTKIYPSNTFSNKLQNVWKDADNHPCAVANLVIKSGQQGLFDQVAATDNFIRVADVKDGQFADWILTSGFTQEELALIQRPMMPVAKRPHPAKPVKPAAMQQFAQVPEIDAKKKADDTARLAKLYAAIEVKLTANSKSSIDRAVNRLMADEALAVSVVAVTHRKD